MIYVLKSGAIVDDKLIYLIKVGYTENFEKRFSQYLSCNPTIKPLFLIDNGTEADEKQLHRCLEKYRFEDYGNEWYYYSEEFLDIFYKNKTIEELRTFMIELMPEVVPSARFSVLKSPEYYLLVDSAISCGIPNNYYLNLVIFLKDLFKCRATAVINEAIPLLQNVCGTYTDDIISYFKKSLDIYYENRDAFRKVLKSISKISSTVDKKNHIINRYGDRLLSDDNISRIFLPIVSNRLKQFINRFGINDAKLFLSTPYVKKFFSEYDTLTNSTEKIEYLCNSSDIFTEKELDIILDLIDDEILANCYRFLGKDKIVEYGYNCPRLMKSLSVEIFDVDNLRKKIMQSFHVGDRLSKVYIKAELGRIYNSLNYKKTPKAVDLSEWFELKLGKFKNAASKWENGFEILSLKP